MEAPQMQLNAEALICRWFDEVWNQGRREAIAELLSPDGVLHEGEDATRGHEGFYRFFDRMRASFSNIHVTVHQVVSQADMACARWTSTLTHTGFGMGVPPTGKTVEVSGISMVRAEGGKLVEGWQNWDMLHLISEIQGGAQKHATYVASR